MRKARWEWWALAALLAITFAVKLSYERTGPDRIAVLASAR